jgi:hypothetical protein
MREKNQAKTYSKEFEPYATPIPNTSLCNTAAKAGGQLQFAACGKLELCLAQCTGSMQEQMVVLCSLRARLVHCSPSCCELGGFAEGLKDVVS